jgi:hypothetical protein
VFALYMFTRDANAAAAMTTAIDALGYGPTFTRGWSFPRKDSVTSFAINAAKFVPSLMAMDPISFATSFYPATLLVLNTAVAIMLLMRRRASRPALPRPISLAEVFLPKVRKVCYRIEAGRIPCRIDRTQAGEMRWEMPFEASQRRAQ